jgi:enoyl-CoA hydratase
VNEDVLDNGVPFNDDVLLVERRGAVALVTLNRPDHLNAFSDELHAEYARLWADIAADPDVRAVVLTGAGRAFCAGGSIDDFDLFRTDFAARRKSMRDARRLVDEMLNVHVPVVAAVNGPAVGLGCTLSTLCDIVFIAEDTYLADPHVAVALVAGDGGAVTWPAYTSLLKVKQYLLTGDRVPAQEAVAIGLANFAVPAADVVSDALAFAERLAALPAQAVQDTKSVLNQSLRLAAVNALGFGLAAESQSHDTTDYAAIPEKFRARDKRG